MAQSTNQRDKICGFSEVGLENELNFSQGIIFNVNIFTRLVDSDLGRHLGSNMNPETNFQLTSFCLFVFCFFFVRLSFVFVFVIFPCVKHWLSL